MKRIASLIFALLFFSAAHAQTIKSGHVLGNGTASERSATDTQLMGVMQQPGAGLGSGVANMLGGASTGTGGPVGQNSPTINNPTIVGGTQGFSSLSMASTAAYTIAAPATASGNTIAIVAPWLQIGYLVTDTTTPSAIPAGSFITSIALNGNIVLNNNVTGVLLNDTLTITPPTGGYPFAVGALYPCMNLVGGIKNVSGLFFDTRCNASFGWQWQPNGITHSWLLGASGGPGNVFPTLSLNNGYDGAGYIIGSTATIEFPTGFTISNANFSTNVQFERFVDGATFAPEGRLNKAFASASWATSAMTIQTSFGCGAGFGLGVAPGETLLDLSLPTGASTASIIGTIDTCNSGTGVITLVAPGATQGSATTSDNLVGIVQATYSWNATASGVGPDTQAIPMATCTNLNGDSLGMTLSDLSITGIPVIGETVSTGCVTEIILTGNALKGAKSAADNLLYALPASTAFTTSQNYATVGGCDALAAPEVLVDVSLAGNPNIGAVSSCASNVLALTGNALINSAGAADPLLFGNQATGPWIIGAITIPVTSCNPFTPNQALLLDLTIGGNTVISDFESCASPTSIRVANVGASQPSAGSADRLLWARLAYQTWPSGNQIAVNAGNSSGVGSCTGVTAGEVIYDMSVGGGTLVGTVASCQFYAAINLGGLITLTAPVGTTVTHNDYLVFATTATGAFTTTPPTANVIPITSCNNYVGPALFDAAVTLSYVGAAAGCGGKVTLTTNALQNSSGPTDNLVPVTPATASWALHATSINVASCTGFANPQYVADMTLATPAVIGQITTCTPGSPNVITIAAPGASSASSASADLLAPSTLSTVAQSLIPAGGNFSWSNAVRHIPVPNCAGATPADAVLDLSLTSIPLIGSIGVCGPTMLISAPPLTSSAAVQGLAPAGQLDYLLLTARRNGDYRINQKPSPGGFALWALTDGGTVASPAAPVAVDPGATTWSLGNYEQLTPVPLASLPTCAVANVITAGVMTKLAAGTRANISNGVAGPTYNAAVGSTTGLATDAVYCYYSGSVYSWVYR